MNRVLALEEEFLRQHAMLVELVYRLDQQAQTLDSSDSSGVAALQRDTTQLLNDIKVLDRCWTGVRRVPFDYNAPDPTKEDFDMGARSLPQLDLTVPDLRNKVIAVTWGVTGKMKTVGKFLGITADQKVVLLRRDMTPEQIELDLIKGSEIIPVERAREIFPN
jgi:hypothetical protein